MTTLQVGGHGDQVDPIAEAAARGATLAQFFLGDPQAWKGPEIRYAGGATALKAAAEEAGIRLYVHAPYVLNVATTNNRIRIPSRKFLQQYVDAAAEVGAAAVIVHGGHVLKNDDPAIGFDNWRKCIDGLEMRVPVTTYPPRLLQDIFPYLRTVGSCWTVCPPQISAGPKPDGGRPR